MKKCVVYLMLVLVPVTLIAQEADVDSAALVILDRMSRVIGDLESVSFSAVYSQDKPDNTFFHPIDNLGLLKEFNESEVYMLGPDKLMMNSDGDEGHRGYFYNGHELVYYSYDHNYYAILEGEANILEMIYQVNENYDIYFPAADFFNPYFTDDLLLQSDKLKYLGTSKIDGKQCFRIIASNKDRSVQLWISDDALTLPKKMVVVSFTESHSPQYEITFSNWNLNPNLPESIFDFDPPPGAHTITLVPKKSGPE